MAATPQYGMMMFVGRSGMSYAKDVYVSDVNGAKINWDSGSGAGSTSDTFWIPPEPVVLRDFAIVTGTADTEKLRLTRNGIPSGDTLRYGPHTDSVATRPRLNIPFAAGIQIGALQISD